MLREKGFAPLIIILGILIILGITSGVYYIGKSQSVKPVAPPSLIPVATSQTSQTSPVSSPNSSDETANWKIYNGRYFSFRYPSTWTDNTGPAATYSINIEVIGLRISPNAVFEASYQNASYENNIQGLIDRSLTKLLIAGRESTRFDLNGGGEPLPSGFSIISFIIKGQNGKSYSIVFNGSKKDIPDILVTQIISTFTFSDQNQTGSNKTCQTDSDCTNGSSCKSIGPLIINQLPRKECIAPGQVTPL